jgi:cobalamin biosynthesis Mg chelatase CobN
VISLSSSSERDVRRLGRRRQRALGVLAARPARLLYAAVLGMLVLLAAAVPSLGAEEFTREELPKYEQQLAAKQVASASVNKFLRTVDATLKNGEKVVVRIAKGKDDSAIAALHAAGAKVTVLSSKQARSAKPEKRAHTHHKKRDAIIIAIVVVVLLVLVGGFLWLRRRSAD